LRLIGIGHVKRSFKTLCSGKFLVQEYRAAMNSLSKGSGGSLTSTARRVSRIEAFLSQFNKMTITADIVGMGINKLDVLARYQGKGKKSGSFICSYSDGAISVGPGGYHVLNTNTDVPKTDPQKGSFAYAVIQHGSAGTFGSFEIEVTSSAKDPTNLDSGGDYVEFSNVLLAEVVGTGDDAKFVQRREGNLSLVHQVIDGKLCLWPLCTGGSAL
jgi:hypothetical protein